ncbi:MAG: ornithine cyclodeaminase family protein [Gemmatimonadetes bacterium]|nr:ornithine cyclodeaminase family protein [Gemmatimonadota bacterium]
MNTGRSFDGAAVRALLRMDACIAAMRAALRSLSRGEVVLPQRPVIHVPDGRGSLYVMPAWVSQPEALAVKLVTLFPGNRAAGLETHQGVVVLFGDQGEVCALIDAGAITAIRTAAVSAAATDALARVDAGDLAILGSGVQARSHIEAMQAVRAIRRVRIWNRTAARADALADAVRGQWNLDVDVCATAREAVRAADLVCTVTGAREPVLEGRWLNPGTHINAVGASTPDARELDSDAIANAGVWVDALAAALAEAGDILIPIAEGRIAPSHVRGELGAVLDGLERGRRDATEITVFKSLGLAVEDAVAARLIWDAANAAGPAA